jgi:RimJ/RimL family protein N-acetyltransferase
VGLLWVSWPSESTVTFGMALWPLCRGLGIGWRVRDAIYEFLFSDAAIHKIETCVYSPNSHSLAALHGAKARAVEEGRQRETIRIDGVYYDRILFGCTRARWAAVRPVELDSNSAPWAGTVPSVRPLTT